MKVISLSRHVLYFATMALAALGCARARSIVGTWDVRSGTGAKTASKAIFGDNGSLTIEYVIATTAQPPGPPKPTLIERQRGTYSLQGGHLSMRLYTMEFENLGKYEEHIPYLPGAKKLSKTREGFISWKSTNEFEFLEHGSATAFQRSRGSLF